MTASDLSVSREDWGGRFCADCGDPITTSYVIPDAWVHVNPESWVDRPHQAVPEQVSS